jgi:hypothetical protein
LNTDKIFQVGRSQNLRKRSDNSCQIDCGKEPGPLDQHPMKEGSTEERNRSHPLDMSAKDQQPLDPKVRARDLILMYTREWTCQSPEVIRDHPSLRRTSGARSITLGVCGQGEIRIVKDLKWVLVLDLQGDTCRKIGVSG